MKPEEKARQRFDELLTPFSWKIQDESQFNPSAGLGVVLREFPISAGPVDYMLVVDRNPVGVIEAKTRRDDFE